MKKERNKQLLEMKKEKFVKLNHCFDPCEVYQSALERLLALVKLPVVGQGSSRIVFRLDENLVLKVAKNLPGLAQNKIEYSLRNSEFVCNTYLKDQRKLPAWLVADYCTKAFKKHIKEQFKMTPYQFDTLLYDGKYKLTHGKKFKIRSQNSEKAQKFLVLAEEKKELFEEEKTFVDKDFFCEKIKYLREKYGYTEFKGDSVEFHATGMVTFPLLGTKADIQDKVVFDPTREKRKVLYPEIMEIFKDYTVYIGGSSSFDFSAKNYNKYDAIMRYAKENGYELDEILYVGDDFVDGGGDSHVRLGGLDFIEITDYTTLKEKLSYLLE